MIAFMEARHECAVRERRRLRFWSGLFVDTAAATLSAWAEYLSVEVGRMAMRDWPRIAWHESGLRFLKRRKIATAMVVVTVGLALGATNVAFAVLDALLLSSFGILQADRVVVVTPHRDLAGIGTVPFAEAYPNYRLLRESTQSFEALAGMTQAAFSWDDGQEARALNGARVTASFFSTTGVSPVLGRAFRTEEEGPSPARVVIVSHALWQSAFDADRGVIGRSIPLDGVSHEIVGVMPPGFARPLPSDVWVPFDLPAANWERILAARGMTVYGRLAAGVSMSAAEEEMRRFTVRATEASRDNEGFTYGLLKLREQELPRAERALFFVQLGSLLLLLLAILNLGVVLVAWGIDRRQEMSVRLALGAGAARIALGLLFQGAFLVVVSALVGVGITAAALPAIRGLEVPSPLAPYLAEVGIDGRTFLFGTAIALAAALAAAAVPAWMGRHMAIGDALRAGSRSSGLAPVSVRMQKALLALQSTLAVVLLGGAFSLGISFRNLADVDPGFDADGRMVSRIQLPVDGYATHEERAAFGVRFDAAIQKEREIARAGFTTVLPLGDPNFVARFVPTEEEADPSLDPPALYIRRVSPGYLDAIGIPLVAGRPFREGDDATSEPVAIVSRSVAERFWPGTEPVGRPLYRIVPGDTPLRLTVVGVAGDLIELGLERPPGQTIYVPWAQNSTQRISVVFEPRVGAVDAGAALRRALRAAAPGVAAGPIVSMTSIERQANVLPWLQGALVSAFAAVALCIALLGTYGVMSQMVASRRRDHEVRLAFGAAPAMIAVSVLRSAATSALPGVVAGVGASWLAFSLLLRPILFGVGDGVAWVWLGASAGMLLLIAVATLPSALSAARLRVGAAGRGE